MTDGDEIEGIDDAIGTLLALPPEEFTERRNALAKELRGDGRRDAADAVKSLPRPSPALWALNALAREQPALVEEFLAAADELRAAYRSGGDIRAASRPERAAEARVVAAAGTVLRDQGKTPTETVLRSLGQTVQAAAAGADVADLLRTGRLIREPDAPSIDDLLGSMPEAPSAPSGGRKARGEDRGAQRTAVRKQIAAAEKQLTRARGEERAAAEAEREAREAWESAKQLAEQARRSREEADERLAELREQL